MMEKIALPCWIAVDPPRRIALAVAQPLDLVDDRNLGIAGQDEIAVQRVRQPPFDGAAGRHHRLPDHLPAEHPLPARLRAVAAEHVHLDRFEVENGEQVNQALGHQSLLGMKVPSLAVIPDLVVRTTPE